MLKRNWKGLVVLLIVVFALGGCSNSDNSGDTTGTTGSTGFESITEIGRVESVDQLKNLELDSLNVHGVTVDRHDGIGNDYVDGENLDSVKSYVIDELEKYFGPYLPVCYKVDYKTRDSHGNDQTVSGLLVIPASLTTKASLPILSMQHPTQVLRKYSPSAMSLKDNEFTLVVSCIMSMTGYIVVVPDYPGLGDNYDVHPYCHKSLSNSVVSMIENTIASRDKMADLNVEWNGKLVLMGYSEGGYATMVTAEALQEKGINVPDAVAPLDGPYSLSVTMKNVMLNADASFSAPYFLPYFIAGYDAVYSPNITFIGAIKESVPGYTPPEGQTYATMLYSFLNGSYTSEEISDFMRKATPYVGPRSVMKTDFIGQLEDDSSFVSQKLMENNGYENWVPAMPMKMFHNKYDDLVPHDNMVQAQKNFPAKSNIQYETYEAYIPISDSIHADSFPVAMVKGYFYIDGYAHPDREEKDKEQD